MLNGNAMSPSFQLYGASTWLPTQIYPFSVPMALSPGMHDEHTRSLGIDLEDRDPSEQVLSLKHNQDDYQPRVGDKRTYDTFSFHNYAGLEDKSPTKAMKSSENEFIFS